jgi:cation diffusion facilitator family transporter
MTNYLMRRFVPGYQNPENPTVRNAIGKLAGITGVIGNCLLFAVKLAVGLAVGSVSIIADGVNNLTDTASSVVTLVGFWLAKRPADREHPYGHARYEYLAGLAAAALIMLIGLETGRTAFLKILRPQPVEFSALSCLLLLGAMGVKGWMSRFLGKLGRYIDSAPLKAAAVDSRNDVVATLAVLAGFASGALFRVDLDGIIGLAVAVLILASGFTMAKETVSLLLGRQADPELVGRISALVLEEEKVVDIHDLLVHDYGPGQCFASVHAQLQPEESAVTCHNIIDAIERRALTELNVHLVIHFDPENDEQMKTSV